MQSFLFLSFVDVVLLGIYSTNNRLSTAIKRNNLNQELRNLGISQISPSPNGFFNCQIIIGKKFVPKVRLGLSHLGEHNFSTILNVC